jgi:RimJ/RimL family protein N-acetyltransferase
MRFETPRLILRSPVSDDAQEIFRNYTQDPEVTKYLTWPPHTEFAQTRDWISFCVKTCNDDSGIKLTVFHKADNQAIGMIDFRFDGFQSDFGYVLAKKYWNQGLMTEAMKPAIEYVFGLPHIYRIWATHDVDNEASGRVMLKLGMQYEGTLRKSLLHPNISNTPRDGKYYSLVK